MVHIRQLGFFAGVFLSIWVFMVDITHIGQKEAYVWLAPLFILLILEVLALRRIQAASEKKPDFFALIRGALGVVVLGVVILNIGAYINFKWVHPSASPFQTALVLSWAILAMGMVISLALSFVFFLLPKRKM